MDITFIAPFNGPSSYQALSNRWAAIEPPTWALLLAEACRSRGAEVSIVDAEAERLDPSKSAEKILGLNPRIACLTVYGQNVNAGTTSMAGATRIAQELKASGFKGLVVFIGSHVQALPKVTLERHAEIDVVCLNEGVYALRDLLALESFGANQLSQVRGIGYRLKDGAIGITGGGELVPSGRLDQDLPGYAWDLLPMRDTPLDLYRSPLWHSGYDESSRTPYAAIQTSLGCQFKCSFCMINLINRTGDEAEAVASDYRGMRFWSPEFVENQVRELMALGVKTIKITDEMFLLYKKHYVEVCERIARLDGASELRMWAYSRIDTVTSPETLSLVRSAGIRWLALGIETADRKVRLEVSKGKFTEVDVREVVSQIHDADIDVMANYIVGLPGDTQESMRATLDLSKELGTAGWNMYTAMALPGSRLHREAVEAGVQLPNDYEGWSFHSYETIPMPTEYLSPAEILKFRDSAFIEYHKSEAFRKRVESRFGQDALALIDEMAAVPLRRKLLDVG